MSVRIITGDCRSVLATLPAESVHCVVTSPPSVIEPFAFRVGRIARGDIFVGESHRPHGSHPAVKALEVTMAEKFRPVMASASLPFPKPQYGFCVSALHAQIRQEGSQDSLCQSVARLPTVDRSTHSGRLPLMIITAAEFLGKKGNRRFIDHADLDARVVARRGRIFSLALFDADVSLAVDKPREIRQRRFACHVSTSPAETIL